MLINHCPACWRVNADEALSCAACGADLGTADTIRLPLDVHTRRTTSGALWLEDLVGPKVSLRLQAGPDSGNAPLSLTLRDVDPNPVAPTVAKLPATTPELVQSDPEVQPALPVTAVTADITDITDITNAAAPQTSDSAQRAERRAAVRRGRRRGEQAAANGANSASEVLVVGSQDASRDALCELLQGFGFTVHATANTAQALAGAASPTLLACFVHAEMPGNHGGNGIDLCGQLRQADTRPSEQAALLVLVAAQLRPMDRVRAELAGCDDAIPTPITRGSVARLLDARGIRLPSDPRRD